VWRVPAEAHGLYRRDAHELEARLDTERAEGVEVDSSGWGRHVETIAPSEFGW
jgi:hypothetical protein